MQMLTGQQDVKQALLVALFIFSKDSEVRNKQDCLELNRLSIS
jgi:hypothetical protein